MAFLEGFYYNPRIDRKLLREHSEGLVALSACLGGAVSRAILHSGMEKAEDVAREYDDIMGGATTSSKCKPTACPIRKR